MSCFRLPKTVIKRLTSAIAQFWWSSNGNNRGMHWMAWHKLCRHKEEGGLGFRNLEGFNTAMLAKQLWRLMESPDSLFTRVFKSRYFRNSDPLDPKKSYSPSYGWQSIISARSLVRKGLIKRVGTGSSISVWNDPWIPASRPRPATCKFAVYPNSFKVKDLIDNNTKSWNIPLLEATIIPEDATIIKTLAVSRFERPDTNGWHYTKNGKYTVKSGYRTETLYPDKGIVPPRCGPTITPLQAGVWKVSCSPKVKHFIWQAITGCVSVTKNLRSRGIRCDVQCGRCGAEEETINHVLFECPPAIQTWALSRIPSNPEIFPASSIYTNLDYLINRVSKGNQEGYFPWIIWYLWKSRNEKVFKNIDRCPQDILAIAESEGRAWEEAQVLEERNHNIVTNIMAEPDQFDKWVCQIDGSWKATDKYSGQGWISTKNGRDELLLGSRNTLSGQSSLHAELEALLWAMDCMITHQRLKVAFKTDCSDVVKMVSSPEEWPAFAVHLEEFSRCKQYFEEITISHIPRSENSRADNLARSVRRLPTAMMYINSCFS